MRTRSLFLFFLCLGASAAEAQVFEPTWESLEQYSTPAWFRDAKFGIMMHWGPQSVPGPTGAFDGWYGRHLYLQVGAPWGNAYQHHLEHYGHPTEFGYKDLIPLWRAERWDPDALVRFYRDIGARYIVPVAVHHDNFDLWNSTWQPWNSVNMGPRRDVVGEWKAAADRYGLRFGVSTHSATAWWWSVASHGADVYGPLAGVPYDGRLRAADGVGTWWDGFDPQDLYERPHPQNEPADAAFIERWRLRTRDLVDQYRPDLLYFDGELPHGAAGLDLAAHFYNANQEWHGGHLEAVLNVKFLEAHQPPHAVVLDIEKGQSATLRPLPWQTDTPLTEHWYYTHDPVLQDTLVVHILCDIVSKNGNLLLNVGLYPDGTIPRDQEAVLRSVGDWLAVNGEAIYGTRPWVTFGEGPSTVPGGPFTLHRTPLTPEDFRFTTRGDTLYAMFFGRPVSGQIQIEALRPVALAERIDTVELLGYPGPIEWAQTETGLQVTVPDDAPESIAYALRIKPAAEVSPPDPDDGPEPALSVQHYPNPSTGASKLYVRVPTRERATARVFDLRGRLVREHEAYVEPNEETEFAINLRDLPGGVYLCRVTAGPYSESVRLVHLGGR
jgi:alpha-L-fucosidase